MGGGGGVLIVFKRCGAKIGGNLGRFCPRSLEGGRWDVFE